ncbi:hypothetical protein NDU88_000208, partial [Pleurodeles waltl]
EGQWVLHPSRHQPLALLLAEESCLRGISGGTVGASPTQTPDLSFAPGRRELPQTSQEGQRVLHPVTLTPDLCSAPGRRELSQRHLRRDSGCFIQSPRHQTSALLVIEDNCLRDISGETVTASPGQTPDLSSAPGRRERSQRHLRR